VGIGDLVAEHGSPLWLVNLDILRDRWRTCAAAWRSSWPVVQIAYSYKANRHPAILHALAAEGAGHEVDSEIEYELARSIAHADGATIIVQGPGKSKRLLERAAADGALVVADSVQDLARAVAAGARRLGLRVGLAGVGHGPSHLGVAASEVPTAARRLTARRVRLEALAVHLLSVGLDRPLSEVRCMAGELRVRWPHPPEQFAAAARTIASLAVRLDIPAVDVGGGFPPAPDERIYAQKLGGALGAVGFEGRLIVEPGRALVGEAVDLACTVLAVKRLADGGRCVVVDAGTDLVAGALYRWPHLEVVGAKRESAQPALVIGPGTKHLDVLHPAARLPPVEEGDVLLVRRVGAYTSRNRRGSPRRGPRSWRETGAGGGCALVDKRSRAWSPATLAPRSEPEPVSGHFSGSGER
jgi:diaminopimelate decarboxylase